MAENPLSLACVYRSRNADHVMAMVEEGAALGAHVALWALDAETPALEPWTVGSGPGSRLQLLNRALSSLPATGRLVTFDDDVQFTQGRLPDLLRWGRLAKLDIFQPAHALGSYVNHDFTRALGRWPVRQTTFVEVGPLVVFSARIRPHLTPFPEEYEMGWGLDVNWSRWSDKGYKLGIVDRVTMTHLEPTGAAYSVTASERLLASELAGTDLAYVSLLHRTLEFWPFPRGNRALQALRHRVDETRR